MSAFLLANSTRHRKHANIDSWVAAATARTSFYATAVDHTPAARLLIQGGLVRDQGSISISSRLAAVSKRADRLTLLTIAGMLLEIDPPDWLRVAVSRDYVRRELIPTDDLAAIQWLEPDLDQILINTRISRASDPSVVALGLGRAAELAIVAALEASHRSPLHVAEVSDRYGYDVESLMPVPMRWEVKGATLSSCESFHLTRHEFDTAANYESEWVLVQVIFRPTALVAEVVNASHVSAIRELSPVDLRSLAPPERTSFVWDASASVRPPQDSWVRSELVVPAGFEVPNLGELGRASLLARSEKLSNRATGF